MKKPSMSTVASQVQPSQIQQLKHLHILSVYSTIKCQNTFIFDENYNFLYFLGVVVVGFAVVVGLAVVVVVFVVVVVVEVVVGFGVVGIGVVVGAPVVDGPGVGVS